MFPLLITYSYSQAWASSLIRNCTYCNFSVHSLSVFTRAKMSAAPLFISVPTLHPVKTSVLRWHPVLSRFYPRVQRSKSNTRKWPGGFWAVYTYCFAQNVCRLFLGRGANIHIRNEDGHTPFEVVLLFVFDKLSFIQGCYRSGRRWNETGS